MTTYDSLVNHCKNVCSVKYVILSTFVFKISLFYFYDAVQNTAKLQQKLPPKRDINILHKDPKEPGAKRRKAE